MSLIGGIFAPHRSWNLTSTWDLYQKTFMKSLSPILSHRDFQGWLQYLQHPTSSHSVLADHAHQKLRLQHSETINELKSKIFIAFSSNLRSIEWSIWFWCDWYRDFAVNHLQIQRVGKILTIEQCFCICIFCAYVTTSFVVLWSSWQFCRRRSGWCWTASKIWRCWPCRDGPSELSPSDDWK